MMEIVIDNTTYKIMKYLYGKHGVKFRKIRKKFGDDVSLLVCELLRGKYAAMRNSDGSITLDYSVLSDESDVCLLVPGNKYVEDRKSSAVIQFIPIFLSAVSVVVSIIGLIISFSSIGSEIPEIIIQNLK